MGEDGRSLVRPKDNGRSRKSVRVIECGGGREKVPHANRGPGEKVGTGNRGKGSTHYLLGEQEYCFVEGERRRPNYCYRR